MTPQAASGLLEAIRRTWPTSPDLNEIASLMETWDYDRVRDVLRDLKERGGLLELDVLADAVRIEPPKLSVEERDAGLRQLELLRATWRGNRENTQ